MGHFGFFQLIKNYYIKPKIFDEKKNFKQFIQIFGDLTLLKFCWAVYEASYDIYFSSINKVVAA